MIKDGAYVINLDECELIVTHWITSYVNGNNVTYFNIFRVEYSPKEIKKFIAKNIPQQIFIENKQMKNLLYYM